MTIAVTTGPHVVSAREGGQLVGLLVGAYHAGGAFHVSFLWAAAGRPAVLVRMMAAFRRRHAGETIRFERSDDNLPMLRLCRALSAVARGGIHEFRLAPAAGGGSDDDRTGQEIHA